MKRRHDNALILFARDPVVGQVKTRLNPFLDPQTIYDLYLCFLADSIDTLCLVESADRFVGIKPSNLSGYFDRLDPSCAISVFVQEGQDLGERMQNAFASRFAEGYGKVVIIGADSPSLPTKYIHQAFASNRDVVLGPSVDGGYYLIGMCGNVVDLFEGVTWGGNTVLEQTRERLERSSASLELLPTWYDVDRPEDLKFLKTHLELMAAASHGEGKSTREFLGQISL
jgi:hypothetical protein